MTKHKHSIHSLFWLLAVLAILYSGYKLFVIPASYPQLPTSIQAVTTHNPLTIQELLEDTNTERQKVGVAPLVLDERLNSSAAAKCQDMKVHKYWAHDNPNGTLWYSFLVDIPYESAGENLAKDFRTSDKITAAWMDSPAHKDNLLNGKYEAVGYGLCSNIVVQHFIDT